MKRQFRTAVLTVAAVFSLGAAAAMASQGGPFHSPGKPSTTPPPWSNGAGHGKAGEDHGQSQDDHGKAGDKGKSGSAHGR